MSAKARARWRHLQLETFSAAAAAHENAGVSPRGGVAQLTMLCYVRKPGAKRAKKRWLVRARASPAAARALGSIAS